MRDIEAGLLAEFAHSAPMVGAARQLYADGCRRVVTFTPYPIRGLAPSLGLGRTRLPLITLLAGLAGAAFAYWLQWYVNAVDYPLDVGGRPAHAAPAFVLITFETTVLFAAGAGFLSLFVLLGLPRLWHPVSEIEGFERATVDRFWVGVPDNDPGFDERRVRDTLEAAGPLRIVRLETRR